MCSGVEEVVVIGFGGTSLALMPSPACGSTRPHVRGAGYVYIQHLGREWTSREGYDLDVSDPKIQPSVKSISASGLCQTEHS